MKRSRTSESQIVSILKEADAVARVKVRAVAKHESLGRIPLAIFRRLLETTENFNYELSLRRGNLRRKLRGSDYLTTVVTGIRIKGGIEMMTFDYCTA